MAAAAFHVCTHAHARVGEERSDDLIVISPQFISSSRRAGPSYREFMCFYLIRVGERGREGGRRARYIKLVGTYNNMRGRIRKPVGGGGGGRLRKRVLRRRWVPLREQRRRVYVYTFSGRGGGGGFDMHKTLSLSLSIYVCVRKEIRRKRKKREEELVSYTSYPRGSLLPMLGITLLPVWPSAEGSSLI